MKNLLFFCLALIGLSSCSKNNPEGFPQEWQLSEYSACVLQNCGTLTGADLPYREYYLFNSDGTFLKIQEMDGSVYNASGKFSITQGEVSKSFRLIYDSSDNPLIRSCTQGEEYLSIRSEDEFIGTSHICDGPFLKYKRIK